MVVFRRIAEAVPSAGPPDPDGLLVAALAASGMLAASEQLNEWMGAFGGAAAMLIALAVLVRELRLFFSKPPTPGDD